MSCPSGNSGGNSSGGVSYKVENGVFLGSIGGVERISQNLNTTSLSQLNRTKTNLQEQIDTQKRVVADRKASIKDYATNEGLKGLTKAMGGTDKQEISRQKKVLKEETQTLSKHNSTMKLLNNAIKEKQKI